MNRAATIGLAVLAAAVALLVGVLSNDRGWTRPIAVGVLAVALLAYVIADVARKAPCEWCGVDRRGVGRCPHCRKAW